MVHISVKRLSMALILACMLACFALPASAVTSPTLPCEISVEDLLKMDPVDARDILLSLHLQVCPPKKLKSEEDTSSDVEKSAGEVAEDFPQFGVLPNFTKHAPSFVQDVAHDLEVDHGIKRTVREHLGESMLIAEVDYGTPTNFSRKAVTGQRAELMKLYQSTNGKNWFDNDGWGSSSPICYWYGVYCHFDCTFEENMLDQCPVITLYLSYNNLQGTLQDISLPFLYDLFLDYNKISGTIPDFTDLGELVYLYLDSNQLSGTIPDFRNLIYLLDLYVSENKLSGTIPNFSRLTSLNQLYLDYNQLSGTIPNFSNLRNLEHLSLASNQLTGSIPNFSGLSNLQWLDLGYNRLSGSIPNFSNLENVIYVIFNNNELSGSIPDFNNLRRIAYFVLDNNKLSGSLPSFSRMTTLVNFRCFNNRLIGSIPGFDGLSNLVYLDLSYNLFSGRIPEFDSLTSLVYLRLIHNQLRGSIPDFGMLGSLVTLDVSHNRLSGTLPALFGSQQLVHFDASHNQISSFAAQSIASLETLDLSYNELKGSLPELNNPRLLILDLSNNLLDESLPEWRNLTRLEDLDLFNNPSLYGPLPKGMDEYASISSISLLQTNMSATVDNLLPKVLKPSQSYRLEEVEDKFQCPVLVNVDSAILRSQIEIPADYYQNIFCNCVPGYFGFGGKCVECPENGVCGCTDGVTLDGCYFTPSILNITDVLPCLDPDACKFKIPESVENKTKLFTDEYKLECQPGYTGRACSECEEGYSFEGKKCRECSTEYIVISTIAFFLVFAYAVIWKLGFHRIILFFKKIIKCLTCKSDDDDDDDDKMDANEKAESEKKKQETDSIGIFIFHLQVIQIIGNLVNLPETNRTGSSVASISALQIPALNCLTRNRPYITSIVNVSRIPGIMLLGYIAFRRFKKNKMNYDVELVVTTVYSLLDKTYFSVAKDVLSAASCTLYDPGLDSMFLNAYPWIECHPVSEDFWLGLLTMIPGVIFLFAYPYLLYETLTAIDFGSTKSGSNAKDQSNSTTDTTRIFNDEESAQDKRSLGVWELKEMNVVDEKKIMNTLDQSSSTKSLIFSIQKKRIAGIYKDHRSWWPVVRVVQSVCFTLSAYIIPYTHPSILYFAMLVWIQASITVQNIYRPYKSKYDDRLSTSSWLTLFISFLCVVMMEFVPGSGWLLWVILAFNIAFALYFLFVLVASYLQDEPGEDTQEAPSKLRKAKEWIVGVFSKNEKTPEK